MAGLKEVSLLVGLLLTFRMYIVTCLGPKINGIEFYEMGTYFTQIEDRVFYMQQDQYNENFLLYADGSALKTLDMRLRKAHTIAGVSKNNGKSTYVEGNGTIARFNLITSFEQVNKDRVLVTDHYNHCIRSVDRTSNVTSTYAGFCTQSGTADGSLTDARFTQPDEVAQSSDPNILYICDGKAIRELNIQSGVVSTFINVGYTPISLVLNNDYTHIYVSTSSRVLKIDLATKLFSYLSTSTEAGFRDGPLLSALFDTFLNFIFLNSETILGVDSRNNRLRIIDLRASNVSSICNGNGTSRDGDSQFCQIYAPFSVVTVQSESRVLIGGTGEIRSLSLSGLPAATTTSIPTTPVAGGANWTAVAITVSLLVLLILAAHAVSIWLCKIKSLCCFREKTDQRVEIRRVDVAAAPAARDECSPDSINMDDIYEELGRYETITDEDYALPETDQSVPSYKNVVSRELPGRTTVTSSNSYIEVIS